jgi:hypothetical protein
MSHQDPRNRQFWHAWYSRRGIPSQFPSTWGIKKIVASAIRRASQLGLPVVFEVQRVTIATDSDSDPFLIVRDYERAALGVLSGPVGPYPEPDLSEQEASELRQAQAKLDPQTLTAIQTGSSSHPLVPFPPEVAQSQLDSAPSTMTFRSNLHAAIWRDGQASSDPELLQRAEEWARLMEAELDHEAELDEIAFVAFQLMSSLHNDAAEQATSQEGRREAALLLVRHWVHGQNLLPWYLYSGFVMQP